MNEEVAVVEDDAVETHRAPGESSVAETLRQVAALTSAQRAVLTSLGAAGEPVTAATLAAQAGIRSSSMRETLDALLETGLVRRERMPSKGPGRPSYGYTATAPTDVAEPVRMLLDISAATASVLRNTHPQPVEAARAIGAEWADRMVGSQVPDHARHDASGDLVVGEHLDKIAFFFSMLGFDAQVTEDRTAMLCHSCPFVRSGVVDGLLCEIHGGMARRVIERSSQGRAVATVTPWAAPGVCRIDVEADAGDAAS